MTYKDIFEYYRPSKTTNENKPNKRWPTLEDREEKNYVKDYNPNLISERLLDGTEIYHDVTPEKWRHRFHHGTGTGWEIVKDGTLFKHCSGNQYDYVKGSASNTIDGNYDHKVEGNMVQNVSGGLHQGVKQATLSYSGQYAHLTMGTHQVVASEGMKLSTHGTMSLGSLGRSKDSHPVKLTLGEDGTVYMEGAKHVVFKGAEDYMVEAKAVGFKCDTFGVDCSGDIDMKAGGKVDIEGGGQVNVKSGSKVVTGPDTWTKLIHADQILVASVAMGNGMYPDGASPKHTDHFPEEEKNKFQKNQTISTA